MRKEDGVTVKEAFLGYLRVDDSTGRGVLDTFMKRAEKLGLILADCRRQCYDNGANMKSKEAGVQGSPVALQLRAPPKVSARAPAHRSYHFRGVKLKSCIKKIHHNLHISKQANVRIKHADTEGASHKKFGTDVRVQ